MKYLLVVDLVVLMLFHIIFQGRTFHYFGPEEGNTCQPVKKEDILLHNITISK